jgi:hypothetical protein
LGSGRGTGERRRGSLVNSRGQDQLPNEVVHG